MSKSRRSFIAKAAATAAITPFAALSSFGNGLTEAIDKTPGSSAPSDLKITDVKCGYSGGGLFIKISTNQDIVGYGEGVDAVGGTYHLVQRLGRQLIGRSPLNPNLIFEQFRKGAFFGGGQSGMYIAVLSAFDAALWDLCGKALGLPVYQLLGGKFRDNIRVYCDTQLYSVRNPKPEEFAKVARTAVDKGYTAIKFDLDEVNDPNKYDRWNWTASLAEIERMYNSIAAVRKEVGPHIDICCDMHGRYDAPTGRKVAKVMEPLNLMWLEEPVPADNVDVYKTITQETSTPICGGENFYLTYGFTRLLSEGAVDIIMPDLQKCGGLGEGQRIASLANAYYVPFSPHMVGSFLGAMAAAHVCAAVPNFHILEWQSQFDTEQKWKDIVTYDKPFIEKGFLAVSDKPGIGVDLNLEGLKKYAHPGVPFFE
ncbi:mandelate racemase/muconate lactonizing enzyme family protein [Pseudobacter ginsenosidimutans]|uniref:Galactonate dehydratase n=1 Tax=Pseudobacter ginsenosidimutans TaxID=661488 RepID=A0A4Q7MBW9_9BACT|nr:mandelate racemase/muconate lactonizing enzyme family protein [Pseudobacter ginsenosidimutans]QEC45195.1 mandelate racemase/muconate lactonizing enzyme family protein [Pseudobacter ginsenosidimutans]RZS65464.1 galactonate dehydratase [Pseudobacter ginsenosidimutans]